jgi:hypothetical protein
MYYLKWKIIFSGDNWGSPTHSWETCIYPPVQAWCSYEENHWYPCAAWSWSWSRQVNSPSCIFCRNLEVCKILFIILSVTGIAYHLISILEELTTCGNESPCNCLDLDILSYCMIFNELSPFGSSFSWNMWNMWKVTLLIIYTRYKLFRTHNLVRQFLVSTYSSALCLFSSEEDWKEVWSCRYLFIFLKFVASVIPTIDYDYTVDFDLGGH